MLHQPTTVYDLRRWLWHNSTDEASRSCMRFSKAHGARVVLAGGGGKAGYRGVMRCGRVWTCPTCSRAIAGSRVGAIAEAWSLLVDPVMVTLTIRHDSTESLTAVLARLQDSWRKVRSGKGAWNGEYVRVLEVTTGRGGGWHPHFHVMTTRFGAQSLIDRWVLKSGASPDACRISDSDATGVGEYLAGELLGSHFKGRSQWSLLARAAQGDARAEFAWAEFEDAMKGARQVTWSRRLRTATNALMGVDPDATDQSIVDDLDMGTTEDVDVIHFEAPAYSRLALIGNLAHILALVDARRFGELDTYLHQKTGGGYRLASWAQAMADNDKALSLGHQPKQGELW